MVGSSRVYGLAGVRDSVVHVHAGHVFAAVVLLAGLRDLPLSLSIYGFLLVAPATLFGTPESPLMGTPRYVLVAFPLFIVLGLLSRNRPIFGGWLLLSTLVSLVLCGLFVSWRFVA